jgi:exodeoxyribonuclease VII large subunit
MEDTYTIKQLYTEINKFVKQSKLTNVCLTGEISNFNKNREHLFLTLKDEDFQLSAVCWNYSSRFKNINISDGQCVKLKGSIIISKRNNLQIVINEFIPLNNFGDIYKEYIVLKEYYQKNGYFDDTHKKKLPNLVQSIGIITALDSAALQDILYVFNNKKVYGNIYIKGCFVQGIYCETSVSDAINFLDKMNLDVIILARGGGSYEDLCGFSKKQIIETLYNAKTCCISAIGHEIDNMLSDYVADVRAPTPSIAAEIIASHQQKYLDLLKYKTCLDNLHNAIKNKINSLAYTVSNIEKSIMNPNKKINEYINIYTTCLNNLKHNIYSKINTFYELIDKYNVVDNKKTTKIIESVDTINYPILYFNNIKITSIDQLKGIKKMKLLIQFANGSLNVNITNITINEK